MPILSGLALHDRVASYLGPHIQVLSTPLNLAPGQTAHLRVQAALDAPPLDYDEIYINPYDGVIQGMRDTDRLHWGRKYILPFVFQLHCALALPSPWGQGLMGIVAVLWTLDCFIGAWLTLPMGRRITSIAWWRHWRTSWCIKRGAGAYRRNLDLHRSSGLWLWAILFIFAWSSVMFNLRPVVWQPVMALAFKFDDNWRNVPDRPIHTTAPAMNWHAALDACRSAMNAFAAQHRLHLDFEETLSYDPNQHTYTYMVHSSADLRHDIGNTALLIDADTGDILAHYLPTGAAPGDTVGNWLGALHMGHVFGLPYRVFISVLGMTVVMLAVTGIYIWWKKRRSQQILQNISGISKIL
jgi:uncharacterized iron-regulated membrane protein